MVDHPTVQVKSKVGESTEKQVNSIPWSSSSLYIWNQPPRQANISGNDRPHGSKYIGS